MSNTLPPPPATIPADKVRKFANELSAKNWKEIKAAMMQKKGQGSFFDIWQLYLARVLCPGSDLRKKLKDKT